MAQYITYTEASVSDDWDYISRRLLTGSVVLFIDLFAQAIMIDAWPFPTRGVEEPDDEKVLRGAHDGFTEILVFNTALIRRRIRSENLVMEMHTVGTRSKTSVALAYLDNKVDQDFLKKLQSKIDSLQVNSLTMAQESLNEALVEKGWYNPFPKVRYTERPDAAAASIAEGSIVVIIDNTSSVMILPSSFLISRRTATIIVSRRWWGHTCGLCGRLCFPDDFSDAGVVSACEKPGLDSLLAGLYPN